MKWEKILSSPIFLLCDKGVEVMVETITLYKNIGDINTILQA
jgi:hypothetical protein